MCALGFLPLPPPPDVAGATAQQIRAERMGTSQPYGSQAPARVHGEDGEDRCGCHSARSCLGPLSLVIRPLQSTSPSAWLYASLHEQ